MSIFDEIIAVAEQKKARHKADYVELPSETWIDFEVEYIAIYLPDTTSVDSLMELERWYVRHILARPTEVLALLAAAGMWDYELPLNEVSAAPIVRLEKYCDWCEAYKPLKEFARDKRFAGGRHHYCDSCRENLRHAKWTRGA